MSDALGISGSASATEAVNGRLARAGRQALVLLRHNMHAQGVFLTIAAAFVLVRFVLLEDAPEVLASTIARSLWTPVAAWALALCGYLVVSTARSRSISGSFDYLWRDVFTWRNAATALPAAIAFALMMNTFSHFKANITDFNAYDLDPVLAQWDRALHFGVDPWRVTEAMLGHGWAVKAIDVSYYLWFFVIFTAAGIAMGMPASSALRHRFLVAFALVWIVLGVLVATALASVGPIYYDSVYGGPSAFTELLGDLRRADAAWDLKTMAVREMLWSSYVDDRTSIVSGISAMPSIHNAVCILLVLAALRVSRPLALAAAAFALLIFVGSIHLGWHYAVDGYASALAVPILWIVAGWLTGSDAQVRASSHG